MVMFAQQVCRILVASLFRVRQTVLRAFGKQYALAASHPEPSQHVYYACSRHFAVHRL
jgi:hypothetical protein